MKQENKNKKFINKAISIYGDYFDFKYVEYIDSRTKIKIICPIHGIFEIEPNIFLKIGCEKCTKQKKYLNKFQQKHENKYDYSLFIYERLNKKIKIICPVHGIFEQYTFNHSVGDGCPRCANKNITTEIFIKKSNEIHNNKYDYSLVEYVNTYTKVTIICPEHGGFEQTPNAHTNSQKSQGCPMCKYDKHRLKIEDFISRSNEIHENKYDYSLVEYKDNTTKVKIICKEHGVFEQTPKNHLKTQGCPICSESKGEYKVRMYLEKNNIKYIIRYTFKDCRNIYTLPFDFYLPDYIMCIEYDGIQHFESIDFFGGQETLSNNKIRDNIKTKYCKENDINLLRIRYDENISTKLIQIYNFTTSQ